MDVAMVASWGGLHDERQVLQFFLHAIEVAAHFFQTADGIAGSGTAHAIAAAGEETTQNFGCLP